MTSTATQRASHDLEQLIQKHPGSCYVITQPPLSPLYGFLSSGTPLMSGSLGARFSTKEMVSVQLDATCWSEGAERRSQTAPSLLQRVPLTASWGSAAGGSFGSAGGTDDEDHSLMSAACSLPSSADPAPSSGSPYRTCPEPSWLRPEEKREDVGTSQR